MKNNKKGFTLIELLAVIVILAVIALIAVPQVLNIIENARKGAFARSADGILKASKMYYMSSQLDSASEKTTFYCASNECVAQGKVDENGNPIKLEMDGSVGYGTINIESDGSVAFSISDNRYCATKNLNSEQIKVTKGNCNDVIEDTTNPIIQSINTSKTENSITIIVNAYDDESGISFYEYSINGREYKEGSNTYTFNDLSDGTYTIKVKVTNGVNLYTEEEKEVIIEKAKPICPTPIITIENKEKWTASKNVTIDYGNVEGCAGKYSLDGSNFTEGTNITVNENTTIYAINEGGENTSLSQEEITKIDNTNPSINVTEVSSKTNSIEITFSSLDEQSGIKNAACVYGETNTYGKTGTIEGNICKINNLKNNTAYYYKITTENNAGLTTEQEGNTKTGEFSNISITSSSENYERSKTYTITGETNGAIIEYKVTNGSAVKQDWTSYTESILVDYESNEENKTVIYARLNDGVNTSSEISIEETKIDTSSPLNIALSSNGNSNYNKSLNITVTLQDEHSGLQAGSIKYGWSTSNTVEPSSYTTVSTSATTGTNVTTFIANISNLTGSYYLWVVPVNYKDKAGNSNTTTVKSTGTFNFDNTAPTLTLGTVTSTTNSITIPISTNSDSHSGIKSTTCVYGTSTSYGSTGTIRGNTCTISGLNSSTTYYYKVTSTDNLGNVIEKTGSNATLAGHPTIVTSGKPKGTVGVVYLDPRDLTKSCDASNSTVGTGTGGCMKWYAFEETSTSYTMILDHNTPSASTYKGAKSILSQLYWDSSLNPRPASMYSIADIISYSDFSSEDNGFRIDKSCQGGKCVSDYHWLFDYLAGCKYYGCEVEDSAFNTWYTSTTDDLCGENCYWSIDYRSYAGSGGGGPYSFRPVITVQKSNF